MKESDQSGVGLTHADGEPWDIGDYGAALGIGLMLMLAIVLPIVFFLMVLLA